MRGSINGHFRPAALKIALLWQPEATWISVTIADHLAMLRICLVQRFAIHVRTRPHTDQRITPGTEPGGCKGRHGGSAQDGRCQQQASPCLDGVVDEPVTGEIAR